MDDYTAAGTPHYYTVQDRLGSIRGLVKQDGTWQGTLAYKPYGTTARTAGTLPGWLRQRWAGQEYDVESGLYYLRARYYSPGLRRFIQEDPVGHAGGRNVYAYVDGQVLETRDPSGLWASTPQMQPTLNCDATCFDGISGNETWGGGGGAFTPRSAWSEWGIMTKSEQRSEYNKYVEQYDDLKAQYGNDPRYSQYFGGSRALNRDEYSKGREGVDERLGLDGSLLGTYRDLIISRFVNNGEIFVNDGYVVSAARLQSARGIPAGYTPPGGILPNGARISMLSFYGVGQASFALANTLLHETLHAYAWWIGDSGSYPHECRVWDRANSLTRYTPSAPPEGCLQ